MPYFDLDGQSIFYTLKTGMPELPTAVLLHGAGGSHLGWPPGLRRLNNYAVIGLDLPGHGRSHPPGYKNIDDYAAAVTALLDRQLTGRVILIGHSMGGAIAQTLALSDPSKIAGLVLIGTGARLPVSNLILEQTLTDFETVTQFITKYSWSPGAPTSLVEKAYQELMSTAPAVLQGDFIACNKFNVREQLGSITTPTLVIAGSLDKMTPPKFGRYLAEQIANATLYLVENGSHMMMLEQAGEVTAVINTFLSTHFPNR